MSWLVNEERALKDRLSDLTVSDMRNNARPVKVWFGMPDVEVTEASYPFITINLVNISEGFERSHRGVIGLEYEPEGESPPPAGQVHKTEFPIPYDLDYQITTWTRFPLHDRELLGKMLQQGRLPHRFGYLQVAEDETIRRLELMSVVPADTMDGNNKRLFRKVFTVRVNSEILPSVLRTPGLVQQVTGGITNTQGFPAGDVLQDPSLVPASAREVVIITDPP